MCFDSDANDVNNFFACFPDDIDYDNSIDLANFSNKCNDLPLSCDSTEGIAMTLNDVNSKSVGTDFAFC